MKTRLAKKESGKDAGISIKRSDNIGDCSLHAHDFYEIEIITGGEAVAITNGAKEPAVRGTIFFLTPEDFHEYTEASSLSLTNIQFFAEDISSDILRSVTEMKMHTFIPKDEDFLAICDFHLMMEKIRKADDLSGILPRLLESILIILRGAWGHEAHASPPERHSIQPALTYIQAHFRESPTLSEVAATLSLNERYFCKRFKEYTGKTYKEYLRELRLRYARRLIMRTNLPIVDICGMCGYNTQSHFTREFRARYGTAPLALRRS